MSSSHKLPLTFDAERLKADLAGIEPSQWVPHFNTQYYEGVWSGIALRSLSGASTQLYADPSAAGPFLNTPVLERCRHFQELLSAFKCPLESVRLLRLGSGSAIREHSDYHIGEEYGLIRIHVAVVSSDDVEFIVDNQRLEMLEGEAWYLDVSLPHRVINHGDRDRVHLVIDCRINDWIASLIRVDQAVTAGDKINQSLFSNASTEATRKSLEQFREFVLTNLPVQRLLREAPNKKSFLDLALRQGRERGYIFVADDLENALLASRHAWRQREFR